MEEFEWQETQIKSKNIVGDNFNDFEDFTDFASGGIGTFQETIEKEESHDGFNDFADFTEDRDVFEASESFQGHSNNNFDEQISNVPNKTKLNKHQVDFSAMDNQTLIENLSGVLNNIFQSNGNVLSTNKIESMNDTGLEAILNTSGSLRTWQQISHETIENPFQWKKSKIRKKFYASLGIAIDAIEEIQVPANINTTTISPQPSRPASKALSAPISRSTTPSSNDNLSKTNSATLQPEIPTQIDVEFAKSLCSIPEDTLQKYTTSQLLSLKSQILSLSRQTSDILTYWLDQREQTTMDSETYNQMIECLVGHAQKLRDGGSNQGNRGKNFMKKNSVTSGLASLSLSFKNKKSQLSSPRSPKSASSEVAVNNKANSRNSNGMQERPLSM